MLDVAKKHEPELQKLFMNTWHDEFYKFFIYGVYSDLYTASDSTWKVHEFASLDSDGSVIGYIAYEVYRADNSVGGLQAINFSKNKITFGRDLIKAIRNVFELYDFRKLNFSVVVGNPIESSYDKLMEKYGGRVVGTHREHTKLFDGKLYDVKLYEILKSDYEKFKEVRK
jgi:RimJ/RimL family protein N-acetyltransferase